eukprot:scaffold938_cov399-Prasinococcus_capsulatus_cf.AAC.7
MEQPTASRATGRAAMTGMFRSRGRWKEERKGCRYIYGGARAASQRNAVGVARERRGGRAV